MKEKIEAGIKLVGIIYGLALLIGGIVSFRYSLNIGFYPVGVGLGDALFFVSSALIFVVAYGVYLLLIAPMALFIINAFVRPVFNWIADNVMSKRGHKAELLKLPSFMPWLTAPLSAILFVIVFITNKDLFQAILITAEVIMAGMFFLYIKKDGAQPIIEEKYKANARNNRKVFVKYGIIGMMLLFPLVMSASLKYMSQITMAQIGVGGFIADVSIKDEVAHMLGRHPDEEGRYFFDDAEVLWTGVGELTLIEKAGIRYRLPSKDIIINYSVAP